MWLPREHCELTLGYGMHCDVGWSGIEALILRGKSQGRSMTMCGTTIVYALAVSSLTLAAVLPIVKR